MRRAASRAALGVALPYMVFAGLWIVYSDQAVALLSGDLAEATTLQTAKGIAFVAVSAALIFGLVFLAHRREARHHQAHLRAERDLARVLETVSDAVWTVDAATRRVVWRGRWLALTGHAAEALPDVDAWLEQVHEDDRPAFGRQIDAMIAGALPALTHEHRLRAADGGWLWMRAQARVVEDAGHVSPEDGPAARRLVGTYTDLTGAHRQEERLSILAHDLAEARADLAALASAAAHDLRQPVREVVSYAQLLERRLGDALVGEAAEDLSFLIGGARHLETLLDGLMRAVEATAAPPSFAPVDLAALVEERLSAHADALAAAEGTAEVGSLPVVLGGRDQLSLLFDALLSNAIKFRRAGRPLRVSVGAERDGPWWRIIVADNGIGLPPAYAEQVFQAFRRLHGRGEYDGAGMGLAICRSIAAHHGGQIRAEGSGDDGARVVLLLPTQPVAQAVAGA